jgi:hypothetical protein
MPALPRPRSRRSRWYIAAGCLVVVLNLVAFGLLSPQLSAARYYEVEHGGSAGYRFNAPIWLQDVLGKWKAGRRILYQTGTPVALHLSKSDVSDASLERLTELPHLEILNLSETQISDAGLQYLTSLSVLSELHLSDLSVSDAGFVHLAGLKELTVLAIDGTRLTDASLPQVGTFSKLRRLYLSRTEITDAGLPHLYSLTSLQQLDLRSTHVTAEGVSLLRAELPNTRVIYDADPLTD